MSKEYMEIFNSEAASRITWPSVHTALPACSLPRPLVVCFPLLCLQLHWSVGRDWFWEQLACLKPYTGSDP